MLQLLHAKDRPDAERFLSACGVMRRRWLLAQAVAMATVGLATGLGF